MENSVKAVGNRGKRNGERGTGNGERGTGYGVRGKSTGNGKMKNGKTVALLVTSFQFSVSFPRFPAPRARFPFL